MQLPSKRVSVADQAYGIDLVAAEDVQAGHIEAAFAVVIDEVMRSENVKIGKPFQYIACRPVAKTHYTLLFVSESVKYNTLILSRVTHSDPRTRRAFIKRAYIHPFVDTHQLENYERQFNGAAKYLPALVVEVWTRAELDLKALVRVGGDDNPHCDPADNSEVARDCIRLGGEVSNPEDTCKLPSTIVRVIDPAKCEQVINMPIHPALKDFSPLVEHVESIYKILMQLHASRSEFPKEFRLKRVADNDRDLWQIHAIGFTTEITLEDLIAVYFFNMNGITSVHYDCSMVSDCIPRDYYRGGLVVHFNLHHKVPSRNPQERAREYKVTRPSMHFVVPAQVTFASAVRTAVPASAPPPSILASPKPKRPAPSGPPEEAADKQEPGEAPSSKRVRPAGEEETGGLLSRLFWRKITRVSSE